MRIRYIFLFSMILGIIACNSRSSYSTQNNKETQSANEFQCPYSLNTPSNAPIFLEWVHPTGSISKSEYDESVDDGDGIQATINALGLDRSIPESDDDERGEKIQKRVHLLINGQPIDSSPTNLGDGLMPLGPFYFNWAIKLDVGYHTTKLIFDIDTGETVEYEWSFCILP